LNHVKLLIEFKNRIMVSAEIRKKLENHCSPLDDREIQKMNYVYALYCDDTPNIYYIGKTKNLLSRYQSHYSYILNPRHIFKPKEIWIKYVKEMGYTLKCKIIGVEIYDESVIDDYDEYECISEERAIEQYIAIKENVVLNFTLPSPYKSDNPIFLYRFRTSLYEKKIIVVDNYDDLSQFINCST